MELAEAPFSDPESMNVILLVVFVVLVLWLVVTIGGSIAGWRAGRDGTRRVALTCWLAAVAIQLIIAVPVVGAGGFEAIWWLLPLVGTAAGYPLGRLAGPPGDGDNWDALTD